MHAELTSAPPLGNSLRVRFGKEHKMIRISSMIAAALAVAGTLAAAQRSPDFSGVWTPVDALSEVVPPPPTPTTPGGPPPPPPPPKTLSTTISQSATELRVDRRLATGGGETVQTFVYRLDGSESLNQMGPIVFRTTATWDGQALVLLSVLSTGEKPFGDAREVYRLENDRLIVEVSRHTPAGTFTSKAVNAKSR
jgi:hypothetical protein